MPIIRYLTAALTLILCVTQLPLPAGIATATALLLLETRDPHARSLVATIARCWHRHARAHALCGDPASRHLRMAAISR